MAAITASRPPVRTVSSRRQRRAPASGGRAGGADRDFGHAHRGHAPAPRGSTREVPWPVSWLTGPARRVPAFPDACASSGLPAAVGGQWRERTGTSRSQWRGPLRSRTSLVLTGLPEHHGPVTVAVRAASLASLHSCAGVEITASGARPGCDNGPHASGTRRARGPPAPSTSTSSATPSPPSASPTTSHAWPDRFALLADPGRLALLLAIARRGPDRRHRPGGRHRHERHRRLPGAAAAARPPASVAGAKDGRVVRYRLVDGDVAALLDRCAVEGVEPHGT